MVKESSKGFSAARVFNLILIFLAGFTFFSFLGFVISIILLSLGIIPAI